VLIVSLLHVTGEAVAVRRSFADHLLTLASAVAENAGGSLKPPNPKLARKFLNSLHAEPAFSTASLYDAAGNVLAHLDFEAEPGSSAGVNPLAVPVAAAAAFAAAMTPQRVPEHAIDRAKPIRPEVTFDRLINARILVPVMQDGVQLGTLEGEAQLSQILTLLPGAATYLGVGLLLAILVAYVLSIQLQRMISGPVQDLAQVARKVSESRKFSIRARKQVDDEFGTLVDGFNEMLSELERRDLTLRMHQNELEKRVRERTESLDAAVAEAREAVDRAEGASRGRHAARDQFLRAIEETHEQSSLAKYVMTRSAPARRIAVTCSRATRSPSIHPRSAAAFTIAYSPETW